MTNHLGNYVDIILGGTPKTTLESIVITLPLFSTAILGRNLFNIWYPEKRRSFVS